MFFKDTATTQIYTLSLRDALPIGSGEGTNVTADSACAAVGAAGVTSTVRGAPRVQAKSVAPDRKSTRLNSSHANISYAVFSLKKKKLIHFTFMSLDFIYFIPMSFF